MEAYPCNARYLERFKPSYSKYLRRYLPRTSRHAWKYIPRNSRASIEAHIAQFKIFQHFKLCRIYKTIQRLFSGIICQVTQHAWSRCNGCDPCNFHGHGAIPVTSWLRSLPSESPSFFWIKVTPCFVYANPNTNSLSLFSVSCHVIWSPRSVVQNIA